MSAAVAGGSADTLPLQDVLALVAEQVRALGVEGARVCVVVPDDTRSCPLPELLGALRTGLAGAAAVTVLVALGTHPEMPPERLSRWLADGRELGAAYPGWEVRQHEWWRPETFVELGVIPRAEVEAISGGLLAEDVPVRVNRAVAEHDLCLVLGPVFPHEVVGFSGGDKYFFPGISGPEVIGTSHWLGALHTSKEIIGTTGITPVRALIHRAAEMVPARRACVALTVRSGSHDVYRVAVSEPPVEAWAACAEVSAQVHVRRLDRPVRRVLSVVSERYDEMWTAAKGFYKVEPVVADGGEVTLYAPHVTAVSHTFGELIERVGYHCRDWVLGHWSEVGDVPRSVLAHSTHVRGAGTYDVVTGVEHARVRLVLATGIPEQTVRRLGVDYRDPATVDVAEWADDPEALVVPDAGEVLFGLR
ncbi:nickel-dependent lactate racemase [Motilibacter rhizosphaerae]|uniref:Nickel-dependent lactate racemase n=1 Tax=Motilibacter rhizosphaerae TaxID=598652 RepID=A0A4Q7NQG2_9ACTN|nr:lactate racemase domain-containing protein [Motilibacter rhizosphaerae]RZS87561.1 nickel-dependent lactate racemase [Motilibacter rhizosphaerae]